MGTMDRKARHRRELRRRILDTARELFAADGYGAVTLRAVAERIEYSPTAIYGYFPDKHTLVRTLCEEDWQHFIENFRRAAEEPDPLARLLGIGRAYVQFALSHPNQFRILFISGTPRTKGCGSACLPAASPDAYTFVHAAVAEAVASARIPAHGPGEADLIADAFCLAMHGVAAMHVSRSGGPAGILCDPGETVEFLMTVMFRGVLGIETSERLPDPRLPRWGLTAPMGGSTGEGGLGRA